MAALRAGNLDSHDPILVQHTQTFVFFQLQVWGCCIWLKRRILLLRWFSTQVWRILLFINSDEFKGLAFILLGFSLELFQTAFDLYVFQDFLVRLDWADVWTFGVGLLNLLMIWREHHIWVHILSGDQVLCVTGNLILCRRSCAESLVVRSVNNKIGINPILLNISLLRHVLWRSILSSIWFEWG